MATVSTNIKINPILNQESQALFETLGLNLSTAVNMFLHQAVREQAIPFRIGAPIPNTETLKAINESRNGIGLSRGFTSVTELMEDLDADDSISHYIITTLHKPLINKKRDSFCTVSFHLYITLKFYTLSLSYSRMEPLFENSNSYS